MDAIEIAQVCHEANRALQRIQADPAIPVSVSWADLDEETRLSAVRGVQANLDSLHARGDILSASASHAEWVAFKLDHGWRHGPVKDEAKKEHPLLVAYTDLPASQQVKDHLFGAIVETLA